MLAAAAPPRAPPPTADRRTLEGYAFFALQTLLAGPWLLWPTRHLPQTHDVARPRLRWLAVASLAPLWLAAVALLAASWRPGAYLARAGSRDRVRKQPRPAGRLGLIEHGGFRSDTGATLYLMPETFEAAFVGLGHQRADYCELLRVGPNHCVHFHDGSSLRLQTDLIAMRKELEAIEPGVSPRYLAFLAEGGRNYDAAVRRFLGRSFDRLFEFFAPARLPLMLQLARGVHSPRGDMYAVARALVRILAEGGGWSCTAAPR